MLAVGLLAYQSLERVLKVAGGHAPQVQPGNQLIEAAGQLEIQRQQAGVELDPGTSAVSHLGHLHRDGTDSGLDLALWQVAFAHHCR